MNSWLVLSIKTSPINISSVFELLSIEKLYLNPEQPPPVTETRKKEPFGSFEEVLLFVFLHFLLFEVCS